MTTLLGHRHSFRIAVVLLVVGVVSFGNSDVVDAATQCGPEKIWTDCIITDGFSDQFMIYSRGTSEDGINSALFVWCKDSKLNVFTNFNSADLVPTIAPGGVATAQVRVDRGSIKTFKAQLVPSIDGSVVSFYVDGNGQAKQVASMMLKGKQVLFKIPKSGGYVISTYKLAGFARHSKKLQSYGCSLK